jgi:gliding motility-associated-like protein
MFKYLIVLFLTVQTNFSFGQTVLPTQTQTDATIGLDRKAFLGLGNTSASSDGYAHDFTLPARTNPCEQITGIRVDINLTSFTNIGGCPHPTVYYNLFYGCTSYAGGATCLPATALLAEPNYAPNTSPPPFIFGNPWGIPVNPNIVPDFGGNLSVDIIPVTTPGCNAVASGNISYEYTIKVTVTVTNTIPPQPPVVDCWDNFVFNTTTCVWDNIGTRNPVPAVVNCWDNFVFNSGTCSWDNAGTQNPIPAVVNCWDNIEFNSGTCIWDNTGTKDPMPAVVNCWDSFVFNTTTCIWDNTGTKDPMPAVVKCWDNFVFNSGTCSWDNTGTQPGNITEENLELCKDSTLTLQTQTNMSNPSYAWSTGAITNNITINSAGTFTVDITGGICSFETKIFNVTLLETPIIENVISDGNNIIITTSNTEDFIYSLDGNVYQSSNLFSNVDGGLYNIFVKQQNCISTISMEYLHFYIPKFFTPNNDGIKDRFSLAGIEVYSSSEVSIFNRYGKLLKFSKNSAFSWDGIFRGENLPSDDYWYVIIIEGKRFTGHFTLKR